MAIDNQQNDVPEQSGAVVPDNTGLSKRGLTRRRFARAGAGASGVLLTLVSQPGLACEVCRTPSGYQSAKGATGTQSRTAQVTCTGRGPTYWKNNGWPAGCSGTKAFGSYFNCTRYGGKAFAAISCMNILSGVRNSGDKGQVAMYLMAAYLNVLSKKSTFITTAALNDIWVEYSSRSVYTVTAGVTWTSYDILDYLRRTMD
ncbi:MAG: hypothetical protein M3Y65_14415 [Pseudomonadota bacterium]|nr:hypothetical protein [Pseudomonadota bacterium]